MISVDDFTTLTPGAEVPEGVLAVCPRCGRVGAEERLAGETLVTHVQTVEMFPDGLLVEPLDVCRVASGLLRLAA